MTDEIKLSVIDPANRYICHKEPIDGEVRDESSSRVTIMLSRNGDLGDLEGTPVAMLEDCEVVVTDCDGDLHSGPVVDAGSYLIEVGNDD